MTTFTMLFAAALVVHALPPQEESASWRDVVIAADTFLDLKDGTLASRPESLEGGYLVLEEGILTASPPLRELTRPGPVVASWTVRRHEGLAAPSSVVRVGAEYVFDLGGDGWGYLRVLGLDPDEGIARLELAHATRGANELRRDPIQLTAEDEPDGIVLSWRASEAGEPRGPYFVWRRVVGEQEEASERIARVDGLEWTDPDAPARLLEYRVARGDESTGRAAGLGARTRTIPLDRPAEWPLDLEAGMTIDLLTGRTGGERAHVEILRPGPTTVQVRPMDGVGLAVLPRGEASWVVPEVYENAGVRPVPAGGELVARLPEGVYVRMLFLGEEHETARMVRQLDLWGGRVLPRAPELPEASWKDGRVELVFPVPAAEIPDGEFAVLVVERERVYGSEDWQEVQLVPADERVLRVPESARGELARYRYRHRLPSGLASLPSVPQRIVLGDPADATTAEALLERAFAELADADWRKRGEARDLIEILGDRAFDRLVEALRSTDPAVASAARALLLETSEGGGGLHVGAILEARAALEGVTSAAPEGLLAPLANERAWAVLAPRSADEAEHGQEWLRVLALSDPDPSVRSLAELVLKRPPRRVEEGGVPWVLLPEAARARSGQLALSRFVAGGGDGQELGRALELAADLDRPRAALVTFEVAERLERDGVPFLAYGERRSDAELALDLIDRYLAGGSAVLLAAADDLVGTPRVRLAAFERLLRARLDQVPSASLGEDLGRERIELAAADIDLLSDLLATYKGSSEMPCDLVLPEGDYRPLPGRAATVLVVHTSGMRLIGAGKGAQLHASVRVEEARDVVLEGISIERAGIEREAALALSVVDGSVTLRECELSGADGGISVQNGMVELDRVRVRAHAGERGNAFSIRTSGESCVFAKDSLLESGGIVVMTGDGLVYLERCVVDGRERNAIQMQQRTCTVVVRDSLLRARQGLLFGVGSVLLEGAVLACEGTVVQGSDGGIRYCPDHLLFAGARAELGAALAFDRCPLLEER